MQLIGANVCTKVHMYHFFHIDVLLIGGRQRCDNELGILTSRTRWEGINLSHFCKRGMQSKYVFFTHELMYILSVGMYMGVFFSNSMSTHSQRDTNTHTHTHTHTYTHTHTHTHTHTPIADATSFDFFMIL